MPGSFEGLIKKYGVPSLIIPNTPRMESRQGGREYLSRGTAAIKIDGSVRYYRIPVGEEPFLRVTSRVEIPSSTLSEARTRLDRGGDRIIEFKRTARKRVRLTLETDVRPMSRDEVLLAVNNRRVLWVRDWSSMGDSYVEFLIADPDHLPNDWGYYFLFALARLADDEIPESWPLYCDSADEFFAPYEHYFTRASIERPHRTGVEPTTPSPELAARIQRWIDELPADDDRDWLARACKELNALPLLSTENDLWALRPDGILLCVDHRAFGLPAEPETDPLTLYAALARGARTHAELGELIPVIPAGVRQCEHCAGVGWTEPASGRKVSCACSRCGGLGWYAPVCSG